MKTSARGIKLIPDFEGFRATAYQDVVANASQKSRRRSVLVHVQAASCSSAKLQLLHGTTRHISACGKQPALYRSPAPHATKASHPHASEQSGGFRIESDRWPTGSSLASNRGHCLFGLWSAGRRSLLSVPSPETPRSQTTLRRRRCRALRNEDRQYPGTCGAYFSKYGASGFLTRHASCSTSQSEQRARDRKILICRCANRPQSQAQRDRKCICTPIAQPRLLCCPPCATQATRKTSGWSDQQAGGLMS